MSFDTADTRADARPAAPFVTRLLPDPRKGRGPSTRREPASERIRAHLRWSGPEANLQIAPRRRHAAESGVALREIRVSCSPFARSPSA
jgi:hypothetical protein